MSRILHYDQVSLQLTYSDCSFGTELYLGSAFAHGCVYAAFTSEYHSFVQSCDYDKQQSYIWPCCVKRYDLLANEWSTVGKISNILNLFACNEKLYAMCGSIDNDTCTICVFDAFNKVWTKLQDFRFNKDDVLAVIAIPAPASLDFEDSFVVDACHLRLRPAKQSSVRVP